MSEQEQFAVMTRVLKERTDSRRQIALLKHDIEDRGGAVRSLGSAIHIPPGVGSLLIAIGAIRDIEARGGLLSLLAAIEDLKRLREREVELTASLRAAGVED